MITSHEPDTKRWEYEGNVIRKLCGCPTAVDALYRQGVTAQTFTIKPYARAYDLIVNAYYERPEPPTVGEVMTTLIDQIEPVYGGVISSVSAHVVPCDPEAVSVALQELNNYGNGFSTALEFIESNPIESDPVVEGLFRRGEVVNAIGGTKQGKSWLILGLALSIASGRDWMGRQVMDGRVALVDNELMPATLAKRVKTVASEMGVSDDVLRERVILRSLRDDQKSLAELKPELMTLANQNVVFIGMDAFYRFLGGGSEMDPSQMADVYRDSVAVAATVDAAVMFNHHTTKGDQSGRSVTDMGSGSGVISRAVDCHLTLKPHELESCAVMEAACRSFPKPDPVTVQWMFPVWSLKDGIEPAVKQARNRNDSENDSADYAVLEVLADGKIRTLNYIEERVPFGRKRIEGSVKRLASNGKIDRKHRNGRWVHRLKRDSPDK